MKECGNCIHHDGIWTCWITEEERYTSDEACEMFQHIYDDPEDNYDWDDEY